MSLTNETRLGAYQVTEHLGAGGMGEVYRATDTKLGRDVAIKTLPAGLADDKDRLARFEREAKLLAALNHPHIASVYSLDEHDGTLYIAMELVEGETLEEKLRKGALPVDVGLQLAMQIAEALEAAHDKGVIHRDLKPANVMVTKDGIVKVLDFGLAKAFADDPSQSKADHSPALSLAMTQQGLVLGTAGYMSPEQASGQATDQRADIWSFGVVLYEMLTGLPLFSGESVPHILADVLKTEPDWNRLPENLHPRLRLMLERCLTKRPRNRYHSIADARVDIQAALNDPEGTLVPGSSGPVTAARSARSPGAFPLAAAVLFGAVVAAVVAFSFRPAAETPGVTRFQYSIPPEHSLRRTGFTVIAFSPDGRRFVYNTNRGLMLRDMDRLEVAPIPGTESDRFQPFFSPDGDWVASYDPQTGGIARISVNGGAPVPVGRLAGVPLGASWAMDGNIYIGQQDGIYAIPATGGDATLVVAAEGDELLYGPSLLPDGETLLFTVGVAGNTDGTAIAVHSLATGERKSVLAGGASEARYVPTGHILYLFESDLFAIAFDLGTLTTAGGAVSLVEDMMRGNRAFVGNYGVSDNGTLVYIRGGRDSVSRTLVWVDREGREDLVDIEPGNYVYPRISPDGGRVALDDRNGNGDIWVWDFAAGTRSRLNVGGVGGQYPAWTPDGERIAYNVANSSGVFWIAANNTGVAEEIQFPSASQPAGSSPYFFTPDGAQLVVRFAGVSGTSDDIVAIQVDGSGDPVPLLAGIAAERNAELSPDGNWIAYQSAQSGRYEVYVRPFPDVEGDLITISNNGGEFPLWSPTGSELFYLEGGRLMSYRYEATGSEFQFAERTAVMDWRYYGVAGTPGGRPYDISRDGERFLAISNGEGDLASGVPIIVVENWFEELKREVPNE